MKRELENMEDRLDTYQRGLEQVSFFHSCNFMKLLFNSYEALMFLKCSDWLNEMLAFNRISGFHRILVM